MARVKIELDSAGWAKLLKSAPVAAAVRKAAEDVAARVRPLARTRRGPVPVVVDSYTTDRAAASVTIAHPAGQGIQAKHGALTKGLGGG